MMLKVEVICVTKHFLTVFVEAVDKYKELEEWFRKDKVLKIFAS